MELSKQHWTVKLYKFNYDRYPRDICQLVWGTFFGSLSIILGFPFFMLCQTKVFFLKESWNRGDHAEKFIYHFLNAVGMSAIIFFIWLMASAVGLGALSVYQEISIKEYSPDVFWYVWILGIFVVAIPIALFLLLIAGGIRLYEFIENASAKRDYENKDSILKSFFNGIKGKYCERIQYKD